MLIRALSDQHGSLPRVPPCDVLAIAGDVCPVTDHGEVFQRSWLDTNFRSWLEHLLHNGVERIIGVAGNHDLVFERELQPDLPWTYLQDSGCEWGGLNFWGTPWTPPVWGVFQAGRMHEVGVFGRIPDGVDVLITHGPPNGRGDLTANLERAGSTPLRAAVTRARPRLHVYGHIHEGHGKRTFAGGMSANVSILDEMYESRWDPSEFQLEPPENPS